MNRTKLTPCRKVGLSRKKNTPSRTVDSLLNKNSVTETTLIPVSIKQEKAITGKKFAQQIEVNSDTPCRQVGLSRKRKTPTPFSGIKTIRSISTTPSLPSLLVNESQKEDMLINVDIRKEQNQSTCAVRLTERFSSNFTSCTGQLINLENSVNINKQCIYDDDKLNTSIDEIFSKHSQSVVEIDKRKKVIKSELYDQNAELQPLRITEKIVNSEDFDIDNKGECHFIKVCYKPQKAELLKVEQNTETKNMLVPKEPEISCKLFEDDDNDFEVSPKKIKSKNIFGRYETDVGSLRKKKLNKEVVNFKKSLSVGDKKLRNDTTISETISEGSITNCFVKLIQMEKIANKSSKVPTPQELSDDDFDMFTSSPPINIRSKIDDLEKKVEEKRNILEELKRAKVCRKLHNINELKSLTMTWQNGCKVALTDLLEQLNTHTEINMTMLLKKLQIPSDFIPLSQ